MAFFSVSHAQNNYRRQTLVYTLSSRALFYFEITLFFSSFSSTALLKNVWRSKNGRCRRTGNRKYLYIPSLSNYFLDYRTSNCSWSRILVRQIDLRRRIRVLHPSPFHQGFANHNEHDECSRRSRWQWHRRSQFEGHWIGRVESSLWVFGVLWSLHRLLVSNSGVSDRGEALHWPSFVR